MILAAHQPHYLPWLGYLYKMATCDVFVHLDDVQYKKREFQNRNRIRTHAGPKWLTAPEGWGQILPGCCPNPCLYGLRPCNIFYVMI